MTYRVASSPTLIGREQELALLESERRRSATGNPRLLLVEGEAGTGKSTLLRCFLATTGAGAVVWSATGVAAEHQIDLGVGVALLDSAGSTRHAEPDRRGRRPDTHEFGQRLLEEMRSAADRGLLVVTLDDAHWCDTASMQAFTYCLRRVDRLPVLAVVLSRRSPSLDPLRRMCRDGSGTRINLGGLKPSQLAQMVRSKFGVPMSPIAARRLHSCTGGNPLMASAIAEEVAPEELARGVGDLAVPPSYSSVALRRLSAAPSEVEELVVACAIHGVPVSIEVLASTLGREVGLDVLDEAVAQGFLVVLRSPGRVLVDVQHPLLRACIVNDLPPGRRSVLHSRAACLSTDPVRAMRHRLRAVIGPDAELADAAEVLAQQRLVQGWDLEAVDLLTSAAPLMVDEEGRCRVLLIAASRLIALGDHATGAEVASLASKGVCHGRRDLVAGQLALAEGRYADAQEVLELAFEDADDPAVSALAAGLLAAACFNVGKLELAMDWSRAALASGRGASVDEGHPLMMLVTCRSLLGTLDVAAEEIAEWEPTLISPAARADAVSARGVLALWQGRTDVAISLLGRVVDTATSVPILTRATARYSLAEALYRTGDWDAALEHVDEAIAVLYAADQLLPVPMAQSIAAEVRGSRGQVEAAETHLRLGEEAAGATNNLPGRMWLSVARARIAASGGDHEAVVAALQPLLELPPSVKVSGAVLPWVADAVEALVALGRVEEARGLCVRNAQPDAACLVERIELCRANAVVESALGSPTADTWFARGCAAIDDVCGRDRRGGLPSDAVPAAARLWLAAGRAAILGGAHEHATHLLWRARGAFQVLGATPWLALVDAALGRTQRSTPDAKGAQATDAVGSALPCWIRELTPAEVAVVELVATGLTNREVASRLVLGLKTIETHLTHAFAKVGVRSRTALALAWIEAVRAPEPPCESG